MESRHIDVLEMDAASHNSVDDVRQINDAVRYAPVSARYKVYILDEVHMLSRAAFNALLKTLEEPPPHAKFVFATTEIRKVPITVLSRCQRFDLRRVEAGLLVEHLGKIAGKENISVEPEALALIARAAEGSVRDSLSLFDQAIAHAAGPVSRRGCAADARSCRPRARGRSVRGAAARRHRGGADGIARSIRFRRRSGRDPDRPRRIHAFCDARENRAVGRRRSVARQKPNACAGERSRPRLSMRVLSRTWQMLLKGIAEVQAAGRPVAAAEMVLVRIAYAADLPTPDEVDALARERIGFGGRAAANSAAAMAAARCRMRRARLLRATTRRAVRRGAALSPAASPVARAADAAPETPALRIGSFEDLVALAADKRDLQIKAALERDVRLVHCEDGKLEIALEPGANKTLVNELSRKLSAWTSRQWMVVVSRQGGARDTEGAGRGAGRRKKARRARATRWCRPCSSAFRAPRSWRCAATSRSNRRPTTRSCRRPNPTTTESKRWPI